MMARAMTYLVWWLCHLTALTVHVHANGSDVTGPVTSSPDITKVNTPSLTPCGDNLCLCSQRKADCSRHWGKLTYVPKLPDEIVVLDLSRNNFSSDTLTDDIFANLTNISELNLSHNNIIWLPRYVFQPMTQLRHLNLDYNEELKVTSLKEVVSIQNIISLTARNCHLSPPPFDFFQNTTSFMSRIVLQSNPHGGTYRLDGFCALRFLVSLELRDCDFKDIASSCQQPELSMLDLAGNTLRRFPQTCIGNTSMFPALRFLHLAHNRIEVLSTANICLPGLKYLDMTYNFIKSYPTGAFSSVKFPVLEKLILHHQSSYWDHFVLSTTIQDNAFDNPNLQWLDLSGNELEFADLRKIGKYAFANCHNLRNLYLASNNFTHTDDQRFLGLFGHLRLLTNLLISNSQLGSISKATFANFPNLATLFLHDNMIADIPDGTFDSLTRLENLFLDNNKIKTINKHTFGEEVRKTLSSLTLSSNPFVCSCELLWFQHWFLTSQQLFRTRFSIPEGDYRCHNLPGVTLANFSMTEQACLLNREVNLLIIQSSSIIVFTLTLVSLVFRYRWHIRLLMYEVFRGRQDLRRQRLLANNFDFDVFVSYASEDLPWVRKHLMPKLEEEQGLKLCIHERDFVLGKHIVDNIAKCVQSSKKILMVFSTHFVRSQWCQFELALCLSHVMDYDDALIVVCVDDVTSRHITSAMIGVLKTTTYIQWWEEEDAVASFWGRLHLALREIFLHAEHRV